MARERKYQPAADDQRDYPEDFNTVVSGGGSKLHEHFGKWVAEKTDAASYFKTAKELTAFELGARFGIRYRMDHQSALDGAHAFHEEDRAAREAEREEKAAAAAERKAARAAKTAEEAPPAKPARGRKAAAAVEEPPAKPARRTRTAAAEKAAPAPKATARPAAKAAATPARRPAATTKPTRAARRPAKAAEAEF